MIQNRERWSTLTLQAQFLLQVLNHEKIWSFEGTSHSVHYGEPDLGIKEQPNCGDPLRCVGLIKKVKKWT
ncbi:unnamed protein product [Danaus chrysippus]|uniref:(African queen) hypothetical protein n=1 Tax=Danaus chrysippus TaxID=151541 RepID=A0A8J2WB42_9NEOP|nr:unnamed protein product [Danaus chrysippus]